MPFVKKNDSQDSQYRNDARKIFIGRTSELLFFVQHVLKPENPTHNIVSIYGQGGVGKSTLLARFIDEVHSAKFNAYCSVASVDERHTTVANIMEKLTEQLHMKGEFQRALNRYREALHGHYTEQERIREMLAQKVPDIAGATVESIPFAGPILREGIKLTSAHILNERHTSQLHKTTENLKNPIDNLTKAFVADLNRMTDARVTVGSGRHGFAQIRLFAQNIENLPRISKNIDWK